MKKFFSSPKKGPAKPVYKHTWNRTEDEEIPGEAIGDGARPSESQAPTRLSPEKRKQPSLSQERRIFKTKVSKTTLTRKVTEEKIDDEDDECVQIRCTKKEKEYYTVVKNVKEARQCHERGEAQEMKADLDYLLSTVMDNESHRVKCLSVIKIAAKCQSAQFRAHLRSRGASGKLFSALADSAKVPSLAVCTACVIYLLARDRLGIVIDQPTLKLVIELVNLPLNDGYSVSQSSGSSKDQVQNDDEYENYRMRVWKILNEWKQQTEATAAAAVSGSGSSQTTSNSQSQSNDTSDANPPSMMFDITLDNLTARFLAIEALAFICCRTHDDSFRKWMRESRGLHFIAQYLIKEADTLLTIDITSDDYATTALESMKMLERYLRILEHSSLMNQQNQAYLVVWESSSLVRICAKLFLYLKSLMDEFLADHENDSGGNSKRLPTKSIVTLTTAVLNTLMNFSHSNVLCCTKLGGHDGFVTACIDFAINTVPERIHTGVRFDLTILSMGLMINLVEPCNSNRRIVISCVTQNGDNALTAFAKAFLRHEAAARETDDEVEKEIENSQELQERRGAGEATATDVRDTFNAVIKKASKHMEDSIVASHLALFLGLVLQQNEDVAEEIKSAMPDGKVEPFVTMLQKFLDFMRLTNAVGRTGEKTISKAIETFEHLF